MFAFWVVMNGHGRGLAVCGNNALRAAWHCHRAARWMREHILFRSQQQSSQAKNYHYRYSSQILLHRKNREADLVKEALHRETQALLSRLNQIKELLSSPEIRMKISKELFEDRHNSNSKWKSCISSGSPNA